MSLLVDEELAKLITPTNYSLDREWVAYVDNKGVEPKNFPEDSEAYRQWTYTGRKKLDKETLNAAFVDSE